MGFFIMQITGVCFTGLINWCLYLLYIFIYGKILILILKVIVYI